MTAAATFVASNWRRFEKNTLQGFFSVTTPEGMTLHGLTFHRKAGSSWVGLPAKEFTKSDGTRSWVPHIEFTSRAARDESQSTALAALDKLLKEVEGGSL